jgi:hypothetical protein
MTPARGPLAIAPSRCVRICREITGQDNLGDGRRAEQAAYLGYGRLLYYLARSSRDLAVAEDALG